MKLKNIPLYRTFSSYYWFFPILILLSSSCASYKQFEYLTQEVEIPNKIYKATYTQAWNAVVSVVNKYDLSLQNQESGTIKTKWIDNTLKLNFSDSFGSSDSVKAARFKLIINVIKGYKESREVTKVTIFKRQMIKQDFLQGWKVVPTDRIQEKTILYRIGRAIIIDNRLRRLDEIKQKIEEQNSNI